jgi:hypothetical protein
LRAERHGGGEQAEKEKGAAEPQNTLGSVENDHLGDSTGIAGGFARIALRNDSSSTGRGAWMSSCLLVWVPGWG